MNRYPIIKIAKSDITPENIKLAALDEDDPEILQYFKKTAADLKAIAPKANDFLYFTCIMMHAAEASALDENGNLRKTADGKDVEVGFDEKDGSWIWRTNDSTVQMYRNANCFPAGVDILMSDGSSKKIENIQIGDEVITHKGNSKKVTALNIEDYSGKLLSIKARKNPKIQVTPEHPFYVLAGEDVQKKNLNSLHSASQNFNFFKASKLTPGDISIFPEINKKINSDLTPRQARLLGLFAAEGCYSKKYDKKQSCLFTFGIHEIKLANLVKEICEEEFPECSVIIKELPLRSIINVTVAGHNIPEWFFYHVGEYSHEKKLSKEIVFGSDDVKKQFLLGWLEGDGCLSEGNKLIGISTSPHIAWQVKTMCSSLGISVGIRKTEVCKKKINNKYKEYDCRPNYRIEVYGANAKEIVQDSAKYILNEIDYDKSKKINYFNNGNELHRITEIIEEEDFVGKVYNFQVEDDNSYIANGFAVHNCDIFPRAELKKAYKKWVGKPLCLDHQSQSVDMIRGVIVDTVYDDKRDRVIALCALDKKNYPDLARKVASGYAASVSMGTAVGRAICTEKGCHRVARVEADFCEHMKKKSGYGEINVDLSPIELSIVVNGADPKAKIKRIIAAANAVASYIDKTIVDEAGMTVDQAEKLKNDLEEKITELNEASTNEVEAPYTKPKTMAESDVISDVNGNGLQTPAAAKLANEVQTLLTNLKEKISELDNFINKMASTEESFKTSKEEISMTMDKKAYFQGGGGVNEPAPKQVKYQPENDGNVREKEDKQMVGQMDMGPVDGMHPGYDSFGESEEARKKRLQRLAAESEQRALRRQAAIEQAKEKIRQKKAYFGAGEGGEPTPGKPKYPVDALSEKARDKEDKQMVGESPFPGVGKTDSLYGDDEKTKKMLNRAKLNARFVKASNADGSDNQSDSRWDIYQKADSGKRSLILSATVKELTGGKVAALYSGVATREFGEKMIEVVRTAGVDGASKIFKGAQENPFEKAMQAGEEAESKKFGPIIKFRDGAACEGDGCFPTVAEVEFYKANGKWPANVQVSGPVVQAQTAQAPLTTPAAPAAPEPAMPEIPTDDIDAGPVGDVSGDPADELKAKIQELGNVQADLEKAVEALEEEKGELPVEEAPAAVTASVSLKQMRTTLNGALIKGMKQAAADISDVKEELQLIQNVYRKGLAQKDAGLVSDIYRDASLDAKKATANAYKMIASFVRYAKGTAAMIKNASECTEDCGDADVLTNLNDLFDIKTDSADRPVTTDAGDSLSVKDKKEKKEDKKDKEEEEEEDEKDEDKKEEEEEEEEKKEDKDDADVVADLEKKTVSGEPADVAKALASLTRPQRDALRIALAEKGLKFSDILNSAHPESGDIGVKAEGDLAKVEDLLEVNKKVMDIATQPVPKNVRTAAEKIQKLVTAGEIDPKSDFPSLIAEGLDPAAVSYWKKMWGEAKDPEASKFVSELVSTVKEKKASDEKKELEAKIARAYEVAYAMAERGLIAKSPEVLKSNVDKLMTYSSENFEYLKETIGKLPVKQASIPIVGTDEVGFEKYIPRNTESDTDLAKQFEQAFANKRY